MNPLNPRMRPSLPPGWQDKYPDLQGVFGLCQQPYCQLICNPDSKARSEDDLMCTLAFIQMQKTIPNSQKPAKKMAILKQAGMPAELASIAEAWGE